ncbi:MAG: EAL domain-containing protein [Kangiellaceae bacterium]|nr:EAL domain-containing protein [Kangiellaceae bacterium]
MNYFLSNQDKSFNRTKTRVRLTPVSKVIQYLVQILFRVVCVIALIFSLTPSLVLASAKINFTSTERAFLQSIDKIRLCVDPSSMPLDAISEGNHIGIGAEYIKLFSNLIEKPISIMDTTSWNQSLLSVKSGRCDMISLAAKTPQREEYLTFTEPFVEIPFVVVTTQDKFFLSKLDGLKEKRLGVHKGYAYVDLLRNKYPEINLVEVKNRTQGLEMVRTGELFGYLSGLHLAGYTIQVENYTDLKINGGFDELSTIELGIGVRKQSPILKDILNKAIASVSIEQRKRIENYWLTVRYDIAEDYNRLLQFAAIASLILIILGYHQLRLRSANKKLEEREREVWHQANFDFLTGLPNRRCFHHRLKDTLAASKRSGRPFSLLLIDLDGFKNVNDTMGHDQGDQLLVEVARRIKSSLRSTDTLGRLGGDEFVVILDCGDQQRNIDLVVNRILLCLRAPFDLSEQVIISASIGISVCPNDSSNPVELLKQADQAMYEAKNLGRGRFCYFNSKMQQDAIDHMSLIRDLRVAINEEQFELYYQSIVNQKSGEIEKIEALIRWQHPTLGLISPDKFIPALEETKLIIPVGEWVFQESIKQLKIWQQSYSNKLRMSINVSPVQFRSTQLLDWGDQVEKLGMSPSSITLEITESLFMESRKSTNYHLNHLREKGFQIALDDFGTGYSSLAYLRQFKIDCLKIDKSFVRNLTENSSDLALCEAMISMAHKLGLKVIAEGVETKEQQQLLTKANCDYGQGYLYSWPINSEDFERLLTLHFCHKDSKKTNSYIKLVVSS